MRIAILSAIALFLASPVRADELPRPNPIKAPGAKLERLFTREAPIKGGLNFTTAEVGLVYSTFAFGGMLAPLAIGVLTDRLFRAERVLGVGCVVSAGLLFAAGRWCDENFARMDAAYRASAAGQLVDGRPALEQWDRLNAGEVPEAEAGLTKTRPATETVAVG